MTATPLVGPQLAHHLQWSFNACDQRYIIQAMVSRQRGSLFGLGRVSNPELTMGWTPRYCDNSPSTLGLGDVLGLRALY